LYNRSFANLRKPRTVWTIPAIHSDLDALIKIHDALFKKIKPGDRILYHGNCTGYGEHAVECVDEILTFRRMVLAKPGMIPQDIVYLRGQQEQLWQKMLQLSFAPRPSEVLLWMLGNGLSSTLYSYGLSPHDALEACQHGTVSLTKWLNTARIAVRKHAGHDTFSTHQQRAAFTETSSEYPMLFVHAGLDQQKSLEEQGDYLWWASDEFDRIDAAYKPFEKVVRGYDPHHRGLYLNCITATVDEGCGFGGKLISVGFEQSGAVLDILES